MKRRCSKPEAGRANSRRPLEDNRTRRHPEVPRFLQRGEGSGAERDRTSHRLLIRRAYVTDNLRPCKLSISCAPDPTLRLKSGSGRDDAFKKKPALFRQPVTFPHSAHPISAARKRANT